MERIQVVLTDLPVTVRGLTVYYYDEDGQVYYTILINSKLSDRMQCAEMCIRDRNRREYFVKYPAFKFFC